MTRPDREVPTGAPPAGEPALRPSPNGGWVVALDLPEVPKPLDPARLFGREAPFEVEVGIGSGYFFSRHAQALPGVNLLGIDKSRPEVLRTADKCRRLGLVNVRVVACDAPYFLEGRLADGVVDTYHVYYSDPWPKTRHHKRRLWTPGFVATVERTLAPGGRLLMKTDVTDYFAVIDGLLRRAPGLELVEERRLDLQPMEGDVPTNFQRKAIEQGHPLHFQEWRRR
jgi:tRNA (guanine-N7-)-methyltransferase